MFYLAGEGNEEISNMIHSYIKEIEDLRYSFLEHVMHACFCNIYSILCAEMIVLELFMLLFQSCGCGNFRELDTWLSHVIFQVKFSLLPSHAILQYYVLLLLLDLHWTAPNPHIGQAYLMLVKLSLLLFIPVDLSPFHGNISASMNNL